jgi:hypothetical protein
LTTPEGFWVHSQYVHPKHPPGISRRWPRDVNYPVASCFRFPKIEHAKAAGPRRWRKIPRLVEPSSITDTSGATYLIQGDTSTIGEHVGHEVTITGTTSSPSSDGINLQVPRHNRSFNYRICNTFRRRASPQRLRTKPSMIRSVRRLYLSRRIGLPC